MSDIINSMYPHTILYIFISIYVSAVSYNKKHVSVYSLFRVSIKSWEQSKIGEIYEFILTIIPHHCCVNKGPEDENFQ
jgi:isoprenylcysteine carboxyl methyltransferase (ICMT) family protein YpbQ